MQFFAPEKKQRLFLDALLKHRFVLYGGAAGGGKSYILRWAAAWLLLYFFKKYGVRNGNIGLFCEDYPTLRDRQLSRMNVEFPAWLGRFRQTEVDGLVFQLHESEGGGRIMPRNLDDPSKYNSTEFLAGLVDELTRNKEPIFDELRKRLRWPGLPDDTIFPFAGGTNPGSIGHAWVKKLWITGDLPVELRRYKDDFAFIQAKALDNSHLSPTYYRDTLLTLPERLRKAFADGDWDIFEGQFFSEWRRDLHVCRPFRIPAFWRRFAAMDWGYAKPACILWFAVDPEGTVYVYREMYVTEKDNTWLGKNARALSVGEKLAERMLDPACWDDSRGETIAEELAKNGWECTKADNARANGWARVRQYLYWQRDAKGNLAIKPRLQIFENCPNLIRTLPDLVFDKHDVEDLDTDGEDHAADTLRYGLMSRPGLTIVPLEEMDQEYAEAALRAAHEHRRRRPEQGTDMGLAA